MAVRRVRRVRLCRSGLWVKEHASTSVRSQAAGHLAEDAEEGDVGFCGLPGTEVKADTKVHASGSSAEAFACGRHGSGEDGRSPLHPCPHTSSWFAPHMSY